MTEPGLTPLGKNARLWVSPSDGPETFYLKVDEELYESPFLFHSGRKDVIEVTSFSSFFTGKKIDCGVHIRGIAPGDLLRAGAETFFKTQNAKTNLSS